MAIKIHWHNLTPEEAYDITGSGPGGLSENQVVDIAKLVGKNNIPEGKPYSRIKLFIEQFNNSLIYILFGAAIIAFALNHFIDGIFMLVVLAINGVVGFLQENKANASLQALRKIAHTMASVIREGNRKEIDATELVPGDIIVVKAGNKIPADARVIEATRLTVNESTLTGEWSPVDKNPSKVAADALIFERHNMVFMGTTVETGRATLLVVATGGDTEFGKIAVSLQDAERRPTPLQKKIARMSRVLGAIISSIIVGIIILGVLRGEPFADILIASLALAASAIPEGLLPAITIVLVMGMRRILQEKGLVRKLAATETLGSVTVICTDKTGTLTEGTMQVSHILTATHELPIASEDDIHGITNNGGPEDSHITALRITALVSEAYIENPQDELHDLIIRGTPTERALLIAAMHAGVDRDELWKNRWIEDMTLFDSETKYAATLFGTGIDTYELLVVGAAEQITALANSVDKNGVHQHIGEPEQDRIIRHMEMTTSTGLRVIACARKTFTKRPTYTEFNEIVKGLTLIGLIAIKDPLRVDARHTINLAKTAGIRTVLITGDHRLTARAIAQEVGIPAEETCIMEGSEIDIATDKELREIARGVCLYARVSPHHKLRIVQALQQNGEVVAMIGDGVNDAPALQKSDIGIALGSGTDAAREASDIVLLDNNLKTVLKTIEEGRIMYNNIRKIFMYLIADSFAELLLFITTISFALPIPLLPTQLLWINVVEDGLPNIALTTERERHGIMEEPPRNPAEPFLNNQMKYWLGFIFLVTGSAAIGIYSVFLAKTGDVALARTAVFAFSCIDSLLFSFSVRSLKSTMFTRGIFTNKYVNGAAALGLLLLLAAIYIPGVQTIVRTVPLEPIHWAIIGGIGLVEIALIESAKYAIFLRKRK
ncbi:MAG: hypothetical protein ACD_81C00213G0012 [uncultured bacterium]|uniref:Calcium-translocating P-type ATPase, PMCA-type n=2 Tax=Candidatus Wolfeibacteriota TaxID=1752735 RepID=A0A0G1HAP5_9BACT|nr:MAG: hypothetical protein ACD_81C00213G0012 [uncultured bacterium]KKR12931.1 MAG: Calcium-translocating P-type ATPase, PMCA-type [Candidatus Wolfebacteria bacterium GW2011_GWC2_39_22]KKT43860.1 MAG: Calcium-translocating P-type ATPase, PMCA-type [Candidatus Wolfebacteria bacterium GW2011_GWE2_44_13]HBI25414.1 hypothetical protein [Candidatus Wolfebacteria bacterium]